MQKTLEKISQVIFTPNSIARIYWFTRSYSMLINYTGLVAATSNSLLDRPRVLLMESLAQTCDLSLTSHPAMTKPQTFTHRWLYSKNNKVNLFSGE